MYATFEMAESAWQVLRYYCHEHTVYVHCLSRILFVVCSPKAALLHVTYHCQCAIVV
jgi:hypothetical protein